VEQAYSQSKQLENSGQLPLPAPKETVDVGTIDVFYGEIHLCDSAACTAGENVCPPPSLPLAWVCGKRYYNVYFTGLIRIDK